ncbi:MAG: acetolactate synthase large subunit [Gemmatimonadetes bacterium]|jgi:acetolactate synthase I/II/III large subunit|nr:acetolactate synthase large subunit [Gemmatimonadota bacterium]MBT6149258.1 acetolactate synthase large subunit [Gemmatimonadota bacterium]MBT7859823.1 acetolactate synthase large subunit [Gemmatimonadota bacterium]
MKASDLFIKALEAEGVEFILGIPGEENLDFLDSMRGSSIKLILTRHEQAAGFMAATYGRLTGKVGVCLSTLGPGATNFVTAAGYAQLGAMPMLMITGQKPIKTSKQGRFQIVDIVEMMKPLTKYTHQIVSGENIPSRVREAFRLAEEERPGAVHLELPEDIAAEAVSDPRLFPKDRVRRPIAEEKAIFKAVEMIEQAQRPLLVVGAGANRKRSSRILSQFVDHSGIPFISTQMGKGVVDERHDLYMGNAALSANDHLHCAVERSDLIINVGHDVVEKPPFFMEHDGFSVIHVNFNSAEVDPVYFPQLEVIGDVGNSVWQIMQHLEPQDHWDFDYFMRVKAWVAERSQEGDDSDSFPVIPQRLVKSVRQVMPSSGIIALDNGVYKIWFALNYPAHEPNTVLLDNALATMGAGLPSAMGARLCSDEKIVAICGDGGFMMNSQELETAVRLKMNLVVLVLRDNAYGMIKWKQAGMGLEDFGLDIGNPDFVLYAQSYGANGYRLEKTQDLEPLLQRCLDTDGVHLIEVPMDYSGNGKLLDSDLVCPL